MRDYNRERLLVFPEKRRRTTTSPETILTPTEPIAEPEANAFASPGFRWFFAGLLLFALGVWIIDVAQRWTVEELTGSPFYVGLMAFGWGATVIVFSFPGGVLADRVDRIKLIACCRAFGITAGFVLGVLVATGMVQVWHIIGFSMLWGVCVSLEVPSRQALFPALVSRQALGQAIAITSGIWSASVVMGPMIAGWLITGFGTSVCFFVTVVMHAGAVYCYWRVRPYLPARTDEPSAESPWQSLKGGLIYIHTSPVLFGLLVLASLNAAFSQSAVQALLPSFAAGILEGNASTFGLILTAQGLGSLIANATLTFRGEAPHKGALTAATALLVCGVLLGLAMTRSLPVAMGLLFCVGVLNAAFMTLVNTLIQLHVVEEMRGRVLSALMLIWGVGSAGSLLIGAIGSIAGVPFAFAISGVLAFAACGLVLARIPILRTLE